jgi:hypothetical protein
MDVEFVTDHDTEDALLDWCARRRREVVPGVAYLFAAEFLSLVELFVLWRNDVGLSVGFIAAMVFLVGAFALAAYARDPGVEQPPRFPQAELATLGLIVCSLIVTFEHKASGLAFVLLAVALVGLVAVAFRGWHAFAFARAHVPFPGRAVHVYIGPSGIDVTVRPHPKPRHIEWEKVRYLGADGRSLFVVAGLIPVVVPRRAFGPAPAWDDFVAATARYAERALKSEVRTPIGRHVRSPKTRRT